MPGDIKKWSIGKKMVYKKSLVYSLCIDQNKLA